MIEPSPEELEYDWRLWPAGYGEQLSEGRWQAPAHLQLLSRAVVETVFGDQRRLIVTMPPRHGKSEHTDVWTPVWYLDMFPECTVMLATYAADFAEEWGAKVRNVIRTKRSELSVRLRGDSAARGRWATTKGGGFYAVGMGGQITGRGADLLIIDDPHKNWQEANSPLMREAIWNAWLTTLRTRLHPGHDGNGAAVIVVMTRWHEDDFVGRLLATEDEGDRWRVLNLPAVAEPKDELGRKPGAALWPARYDEDALRKIEVGAGPYVWGAMYQQHPTAPKGSIFQRKWWKWYEVRPPEVDQWLGSWDMSFKDNDDTDFIVGTVWARVGADKYLVDMIRQRADYVTTRAATIELAFRWPMVNEWIVEEKANGAAILSDLSNTIPGLIPFNPTDSKEARAAAVAPTVAAGNVWLPRGLSFKPLDESQMPTTPEEFIDECAGFPHMAHDDMVDSFTQAMLHMGVSSPILTSRTYRDERLTGRR